MTKTNHSGSSPSQRLASRSIHKSLAFPLFVLSALLAAPGLTRADFIVTGSFGPDGSVGFPNSASGLTITFGATGQGIINQLDSFLNVSGSNLSNTPSGFGTSAQLSYGTPTGITYSFVASQPNAHQLLLTYNFVNNTGNSLPGFQFLAFLDADIGSDFTDEVVGISGSPSAGLPSLSPTNYQVGDPATSTIFTNLLFGTLPNTNANPSGSPGDVSLAIGFNVGTIVSGTTAAFQILLSDNGTTLGGLTLNQTDPVFATDSLTLSARISVVPVPEPSSILLFGIGSAALIGLARRRQRGTASA